MQNFKKTSFKRECPCTLKRQEEIRLFTTELVLSKKPHIREYQLKKLVEEIINCASREFWIGVKPKDVPISAEKEKIKSFVEFNLDNLMIAKPVPCNSRTINKTVKKKHLCGDFANLNLSCSTPKKQKFNSPMHIDTKVRKYLSFQEQANEDYLKHKRHIRQTVSFNEKPSRIPKLVAIRKLKPQETSKAPESLAPTPEGGTKKFTFSMKLPQELQHTFENKVCTERRVSFSMPGKSCEDNRNIVENSGAPAQVIDKLLGALKGVEDKRAEERKKFELEVLEIQGKMEKLLSFIRN